MCQSLGSMTCIEEHYLEVLTIDQSILLERVRQHWEYLGVDVDRAHEMYHDDAVVEFPQSGERFEGLVNFRSGGASIRPTCDCGCDGNGLLLSGGGHGELLPAPRPRIEPGCARAVPSVRAATEACLCGRGHDRPRLTRMSLGSPP